MLLWILLAVLGQNYTKNGTSTVDYPSKSDALTVVNTCNAGFFWEGSSCEPCRPGTYSHEKSDFCLHCPAGTSSDYGSAYCYDCPPGTVAPAGSSACTECPAGFFSVTGAVECERCPDGTTSMPNSVSLSMCTTGTTTAMEAPTDAPELIDDLERAPIENALELHNEAQHAQERAEELLRVAEQEEEEKNKAYQQKIAAEEELDHAVQLFDEVHSEKMQAEQKKHYANELYEEEKQEAELAEKKAAEAKEQSEQAAHRAFEASHSVKMQAEGEANEAVMHAKREKEEHFQAEQQYKELVFEADKEQNEAEEAQRAAEEAARFAQKEIEQAQIAEREVEVASSHLNIQKVEAERAQYKAEMAMREHQVAVAHHHNVLASKERNEEVWEDMLENDCVDDPKGLVVNDPTKDCKEVGSATHWSCDHFDEDFNGHKTYIWELCPVSCNMCGTDRDQYYKEHHNEDSEEDDLPECLSDCPFDGLDINDKETACPWWHAEGPEHKTDSCFNDCSPGVMFYVEHHVEKVCHGGPDNNPLECAMDCPIDGLNPHKAESFCPWFSREKENTCFHDCSNKFLNMAQAHAEHTCFEYEVEGNTDKYINYISEPLATAVGADGSYSSSSIICEAGFYRASMTENNCLVCPAGMFSSSGAYECTACPSDLTSFPGATSKDKCFVRLPLTTDESQDETSYENEDKNEKYDEPAVATVEPVDYQTTYSTGNVPSYNDEFATPATVAYHETISPSYTKEWATGGPSYTEEFSTAGTPSYNKELATGATGETYYPSTTEYSNAEGSLSTHPHVPLAHTYNSEAYATEAQPGYTANTDTGKYDYPTEELTSNVYGEAAVAGQKDYTPEELMGTPRPSSEDYSTTQAIAQPSQTDYSEAAEFSTPSPEFENEEHTGKSEVTEELAAPQDSEYSPSTAVGGELSNSDNHE